MPSDRPTPLPDLGAPPAAPPTSIFSRMALLSVTTLLVTLAIFALSMVPYQRAVLLDGLASSAEVVASSITEVALSAISVEDYSALVDHCLKMVRDRPSVRYVAIVRLDGFALIHTAGGWRQEQLKGFWTAPSGGTGGRILLTTLADEPVFHYAAAVSPAGLPWGWVHLGFSLDKYHRDLRSMYLVTAQAAVPGLLAGLLAAVLLARRLSHPIRELSLVMERVGAGDLSARAMVASGDEVGALAAAFNRMTETLQQNHRQLVAARELDDMVRSMTDSIIVTAPDGAIRTINEGTCALLGWTAPELAGKPLDAVLAHGLTFAGEPLRALSDGGSLLDHELTYRRKDGSLVPVLFSGSAIRGRHGELEGYVSVAKDLRAQKAAEGRLVASLHEKELLLKEVHHRVKNNLQVITSLLRLQSAKLKEPGAAEALRESEDRIKSMALVHEKLYQSADLANLDFGDYVAGLARALVRSYTLGDQVRVVTDVGTVLLGIDTAIPCGLVLNELVANALKHAFPGGRRGTVQVALARVDEDLVLAVSDDGVGLPADFDWETTETLGLKLVRLLVLDQLRGRMTVDRGRGTRYTIRFKELGGPRSADA